MFVLKVFSAQRVSAVKLFLFTALVPYRELSILNFLLVIVIAASVQAVILQ